MIRVRLRKPRRKDLVMTAYLIVYGADPADRLAAYSFSTRVAARAASLSGLVPRVPVDGPAGGCAYVVETAEDVTFGGRLLVTVFNHLAGGSVQRFKDRPAGVKRLLDLLPKVAQPGPATNQPEEEKKMSEEKTTNGVARRGRKPIEGRMSGREQMEAYNALVSEAQGKGISAKIHTSTFEKYEKGQEQIAKLRAKIDAAAVA